MSTKHWIGTTQELTKIPMKRYEVKGHDIFVVRSQGKYHAVANRCTHEEAYFSQEGEVEGDTITCTRHGARFDMNSGAVKALPATRPLRVYELVVEGEDMYIVLDE